MDKYTYFIKALNAGAYRYRRWVLSAFSIVDSKDGTQAEHPYPLARTANGYQFLNPDTSQWEPLEGTLKGEPPFKFTETIHLKRGDLVNLTTDVETTVGTAFVNQITLCYAFGPRVPYQLGRLKASQLESLLEPLIVSDREYKEDGHHVSVSEYLRFCEAMTSLSAYATLCVPTVSPHSLTTDPAIKKRKKELLEQNRDRLGDPAVVADIEAELVKMDRAWLKGDVSEGFYIDKKSVEINRKKTLIMQGLLSGLGTEGSLITDSLDDGWKTKDFPALITEARHGSYSRGALTALGGEAVKFNYRIFQNTSVTEKDCGVTYGLGIHVDEDNASWFIDRYAFLGGKEVQITTENFRSFIGKTVEIRSPAYCRTPGVNFCEHCMGERFSKTPEAITSYAASVGSSFMGVAMSAMHGKLVSTAPLTPDFIS